MTCNVKVLVVGRGYRATVSQGRRSDADRRLAACRGPTEFAGVKPDDTFAGNFNGAFCGGQRSAEKRAADLRERAA